MADESSTDPTRWKIFPRNLTARADYLVRGNPMSSRPESGVNNSFPGLEFDQRTLDERFFAGLRFEFHRPDGAIVAAMPLTGYQQERGLSEADSPPARPLYLWYLCGRSRDGEPPAAFMFHGQPGWEIGRRVRDLLPGRVAIIIGPGLPPPFSSPFLERNQVLGELFEAYNVNGEFCTVDREKPSQLIQRAVLGGERSRYLDADGVIDPGDYAPGELTKTLCAPWMYDFRDCYCFYWASNKPDLVDVVDNGTTYHVNFLRAEFLRTSPPTPDVVTWTNRDGAQTPKDPEGKSWEKRRDTELNYENMVEGWWYKLPVVLNDRETPAPRSQPKQPPATFTVPEAIDKLGYLATVEHALVVEYLYAFYSVKAPKEPPSSPAGLPAQSIFFAAQQIFQIAIDEMRHLLWVNELLRLLGAEPVVDRAQEITVGSFPHTFKPDRLTKETLDWFIRVEKPSQDEASGQDIPTGMYVQLLHSVRDPSRGFPDAERLASIIKLIIDEGAAHAERFVAVKAALDGIEEEQYLHGFTGQPTDEQERCLELCDLYYRGILEAIHVSFSQGERAGGEMVQAAIKSMESFDDAARRLASADIGPRFKLPIPLPLGRATPEQAIAMLNDLERGLRAALTEIGDRDARYAGQQLERMAAQLERMRHLVRQRIRRA